MDRLKLIWLAITASNVVIGQRIAVIQSAIDAAEAEKIRTELDAIMSVNWTLEGISVGTYGEPIDISAIRRFMERAPGRIRKLLPPT
jgi:hypothetical protein